jgi:hypothetical protein
MACDRWERCHRHPRAPWGLQRRVVVDAPLFHDFPLRSDGTLDRATRATVSPTGTGTPIPTATPTHTSTATTSPGATPSGTHRPKKSAAATLLLTGANAVVGLVGLAILSGGVILVLAASRRADS